MQQLETISPENNDFMNYIFLLAFNLIKTYICYENFMEAVLKNSFYIEGSC